MCKSSRWSQAKRSVAITVTAANELFRSSFFVGISVIPKSEDIARSSNNIALVTWTIIITNSAGGGRLRSCMRWSGGPSRVQLAGRNNRRDRRGEQRLPVINMIMRSDCDGTAFRSQGHGYRYSVSIPAACRGAHVYVRRDDVLSGEGALGVCRAKTSETRVKQRINTKNGTHSDASLANSSPTRPAASHFTSPLSSPPLVPVRIRWIKR